MAIKISDLNPEYSNSESYLYEVSDDEMLNTVGGFFFTGRGWRVGIAIARFWFNRFRPQPQPQPEPPVEGGEE